MSLFEIHREKHITTVTLNRPEKRNAMCLGMYQAFPEVIGEIGRDRDTRVLILQGSGDFFCGGADMREFLALKRSGDITVRGYWKDVTAAHLSLAKTPQPVIAKIRKGAMGAGCALAAWCDFRIASAGADFGVPAPNRMGINLGLIDTARFVVTFGAARTRELLLFGANMRAEEALQKGFITWIAPEAELDSITQQKATELSRNAPLAMATGKLNIEMAIAALKVPLELESYPWEDSIDAITAIQAFLDRQPVPAYTGS